MAQPPIETEGAPGERQCGRCRKWFEGDPDAHPTAIADWWACATCRATLALGR